MARAARVCNVAGCAAVVDVGTNRCLEHARQADQARGTATQRGYDRRWQRTRRRHLRDHPLCSEPGCRRVATDVDHIDGQGPLGPRGHDPGNLRSYCHSHHSKRTARDQPGGWQAQP